MSVGFLMDVHVPTAITMGLRRRGVDVLTAQEDQSDQLADEDLLNRAAYLGRLLFTRDKDFLVIAADRQRNAIPFTGIFYAKQQAVSDRQCINDLEMVAKASDLTDWQDELKHLPI